MQKKYAILAAAALGAAPALLHAVPNVAFTYDSATIQYGTTSTFGAGSFTTAAIVAGQVIIPAGDYFRFGVDIAVTNNQNNASGGAYDSNAGQTDPANLGLAGMGFVFNDSNSSLLTPVGTGSPLTALTKFSLPAGATTGKGNINSSNGQIGTGGFYLSGGVNPGSYDGTSATFALLNYAAVNNTLAFSNVVYKASSSAGTSTITAFNPAGAVAAVILDPTYASPATNTNTPDYISTTAITTTSLPSLTVNVTSSATTVSGNTGTNKIISLVTTGTAPTGTAPNGYGSAPLGTLTVTNAGGPGKYLPGSLNIPGGATTGYVAVKGFLPGDAPEVYALQVAVNGVVLSPTDTRVAVIIADIKASDTGDTVLPVTGSSFASLFPAFDILVETAAGGTTPYFAFDFSNTGSDTTDPDTAVGSVTVTAIAAVPEPATAAGIVIGATGLLLRRRNKKVAAV